MFLAFINFRKFLYFCDLSTFLVDSFAFFKMTFCAFVILGFSMNFSYFRDSVIPYFDMNFRKCIGVVPQTLVHSFVSVLSQRNKMAIDCALHSYLVELTKCLDANNY